MRFGLETLSGMSSSPPVKVIKGSKYLIFGSSVEVLGFRDRGWESGWHCLGMLRKVEGLGLRVFRKVWGLGVNLQEGSGIVDWGYGVFGKV